MPGHGYQFVAEVVELETRPAELHHSVAPISEFTNGNSGDVQEHPPTEPRLDVNGTHEAHAARLVSPLWIAILVSLTAAAALLIAASLRKSPAAPSVPQRALRQFTFDSGLTKDPSWSPDARRVAYASDRAGNSDIWVQAVGDPSPAQLTSSPEEDSQPDWSPDGRQLVFRSERDGGGLYVVPADGGPPRRSPCSDTTRGGHRAEPKSCSRAPDISAARPVSTSSDLDGQPPKPLRPDVLTDFAELYVAWRADGRTFSMWGRHVRDGWAFLTAGVQSGAPTRSAIAREIDARQQDQGLALGRFAWSRSGRHVYFEGRAHGTQSVWRVSVDPKTLAWIDGPERLTTGTTQDGDVALSPDGRRLVFSAKSARTRLWMFPFDAADGTVTGNGEPVTTGAGEQDADLPADGSKLVYRTLRGGTQQLWERNVVDGRERLLVRGDQWTRTRPRWSSDGTRLSYLRSRKTATSSQGDASLVVFAVDRGEERVLTQPNAPRVIPSDWSADGRWVLGGCRPAGATRVGTCLVDATEGGAPKTVRVLTADATHHLYEQRFSPDQRWISFIAVNGADAGVSRVYVMPASGGPWLALTDGSTYDDKPHWSPDGRTLYFVSHRDGILNVWGRRFDTAEGTPVGPIFRVTSFDGPRQMISTQLSQMQIALTTNRLFLPITETQSDLWILESVDR